jgi:Ca-activated chloride channel family protein
MKSATGSLALLLATLSAALAQSFPPDILIPLPPPRLELADTNATPMEVRAMSVAASLRGLYATVETTLVFHNPNRRLLEGELVFPLPDGAAVCGYALDINGVLTDGVVVKKEKARVAFETETRRRVDPGLVEHVKGNLYRTRIYPLPAGGSRTIRLTYTAPLATAPNGDAAFLLPMPRDAIGKLTVKIEVAAENVPAPELGGLGDLRFTRTENIWRVESSSAHVTPGSDVWVALPKLPASFSSLEKTADGSVWFSLSALAPPTLSDRPQSAPSAFHIAWDASGSRGTADLKKEYDLIAALPARATLRLTVFRDAPEATREFKTAADLIAALKETPFDGGSDFAALAAALPRQGATVLLFTDGLDTLSDKPMEFSGAPPVAIVSQTIADRESLRQACAGALIDLQTTDIPAALREILAPSPRIAGLKGTGIANVQGIGRPARGRVVLLGQLTAPESAVQIEYADGTLSAPFTLRAAEARPGRTLATAWAAARVAQLSPRAGQFEDDLLDLGRKYGLVSPATSLLVLESLDQWVRHEIEPPASLPALREQWLQALKNRGQSDSDARARHLEQLASLWKARVEWWKCDFAKNPLPLGKRVVAPEPAGGNSAVRGWAIMPRSAAPAPSLRPAGDESVAFGAAAEMPAADMAMADARTEKKAGQAGQTGSAITIKEWSPDTPYLTAIRGATGDSRYAAYLAERKTWAQSPAFFLDCSDVFLKQKEAILGLRILSNLAEMKVEDAALLRVFAWRLRQAGDLDRAIALLRRVAKLRAEEPQSFRDLALALAEQGKASRGKASLEEAMALFLKVALTPWARHSDTIPVFALEELNALVAWVNRQEWKSGEKPAIPAYDEKLRDNLDTDIRIVMSWDADATDIDLHVVEPGGEEAFFSHNRTTRGGLVSRDVTDGYGPEEYLIHAAPQGVYAIKAKYYGSRQQTVVGPATVTATVFTDWGRAEAKLQTLTLRLDKPSEMVDIGSIAFGKVDDAGKVQAPQDFTALRPGMTTGEVVTAVGPATKSDPSYWIWRYIRGSRTISVHFNTDGKLIRVVESLPGGVENIVVQ